MGGLRKLRRRVDRDKYTVERLWPVEYYDDPPPRKISETLLEFAEPLLGRAANDRQYEMLLALSVICWNTACLPADEREAFIWDMVEKGAGADENMRVVIKEITSMLIERKRQFYGYDRRMIVGHEFVQEGGRERLLVASAFVKD